jgi:hypothetical protein
MSVIRWSSVSVFLALAAACSDGTGAPPAGFRHAIATFACGPADGPAVAIILSPTPGGALEPNAPSVRIFIIHPVNEIGGKAWPIGGNASEANASFHSVGNTFENATTGYVITTSVSADKTVDGTVNLTFPNAGHVEGGFHATWVSQIGPLCG